MARSLAVLALYAAFVIVGSASLSWTGTEAPGRAGDAAPGSADPAAQALEDLAAWPRAASR